MDGIFDDVVVIAASVDLFDELLSRLIEMNAPKLSWRHDPSHQNRHQTPEFGQNDRNKEAENVILPKDRFQLGGWDSTEKFLVNPLQLLLYQTEANNTELFEKIL